MRCPYRHWRPSAIACIGGRGWGLYQILSKVGEGGMGEVYRAQDTRLRRTVAIKVLPAEFAADPDRLTRFGREARATAALNHPHILAVYDVGTSGDISYFVTEMLEGQTLQSAVAGTRLPVTRAVEYGAQVARALGAAHDRGILPQRPEAVQPVSHPRRAHQGARFRARETDRA